MALKRIELIFYMDIEDEEENRLHIRNQIIAAAREAVKDGLHQISKATLDQAKKDNWLGGGMIPYNQIDDRTIEDLLNQRVEKVNPVDSKETT